MTKEIWLIALKLRKILTNKTQTVPKHLKTILSGARQFIISLEFHEELVESSFRDVNYKKTDTYVNHFKYFSFFLWFSEDWIHFPALWYTLFYKNQ